MKKTQSGFTTVEMAVTCLIFFWLMLAVLEIGRVMYTWNALTEATRLGARAASVCPVQDNVISTIATFDGAGLLSGISPANIIINYLDKDGAVVADPTPGNVFGFLQVRFVQVSVQNFEYKLLIPGIGSISLPTFTATLPRQSLGIVPNEASGC